MIARVFRQGLFQKSIFPFSKSNTAAPSASSAGPIQSVAGNKAPLNEETVQGRYTGVLFSAASEKKALGNVLSDMNFIKELMQKSEAFRNFLQNTSLRRDQQQAIIESIGLKQLDKTTQLFISTLIDNKRLEVLPKIVDKYIEYYKILQKEENVTIISAFELNDSYKKQIEEALKKSHQGVTFELKFTVDKSILGGLQMYSGNQFLDCSLVTRLHAVKQELSKLVV